MSNRVLQSGRVTPGHLAVWTTNEVVGDGGTAILLNTQGLLSQSITKVNFNQINFDNQILINLPVGFTRWRCDRIVISGSSSALTMATCGVFTATAQGGVPIVTAGSAITITTPNTDTNNNAQSLTINSQDTMVFSDTVIYFQLQNAQGAAATANITVFYEPLP
jgi:hypothetical protein